MKRNKLKQMYYKDPNTFGYWKNEKGEPTAEYTKWLEDTLMKQLTLGVVSNQRELLLSGICQFTKRNKQSEILDVSEWLKTYYRK